jgi:isopenicillin-N N-acyltransferase-like protein
LNAKLQVARSIAFYTHLFQQKSGKSWPEVRQTASIFAFTIEQKWPAYLEEMQGLADGAEVELLDIVALNVRTEIAFGQFSDGCTAISWKGEKRSLLGQNWDVSCHIPMWGLCGLANVEIVDGSAKAEFDHHEDYPRG